LNKILNFDVAFRKAIEPITDQKSLSKLTDFNKTSYQQNTAAREHDIEENIKRKLTYLDQYAHANVIPIQKFASWKKSIKFEKMRLQLNLHEPEKWEKKYLTDLANLQTEFMNPANLKFHLYRDALKYLNNLMVYLDTEKTDPSLTDYDSTIKKHFQGKTQDYLRCNILLSAVEKDSKIQFTQKQYADIVDDFLATSITTDYKIYLQKATKKEPILAKDILIGSDNSKTTLKEALAKGKINYVDFWASWCAPCRAEMPESKQLKQEYAQRGINFIYISIDENPAAWERAVKQVNLKSEESFLLGKGLKSDIKAEFKLTSIPRYILLDREGKVLNFDAPRPSDPKVRQLFDEMIRRVH
jgi:thiol-disulfide isomerase/thioredoxin